MGLRFRKSIGKKGFKINLSKSGIGYSFGIKGLRYTKKAGGGTRTTTSIPNTGISYVSDSKKSATSHSNSTNHSNASKSRQTYEVTSDMVPTTQNDFIDKLNKNAKLKPLLLAIRILCIVIGCIAACAIVYFKISSYIALLPAGLGVMLFFVLPKNVKLKIEFQFENSEYKDLYENILNGVESLAQIQKVVQAIEITTQNKNAAATTKKVGIVRKSPYIKSNLNTPSLKLQNLEILLLPNVIGVKDNKQWFAVDWKDLELNYTTSICLEANPPSDTNILGQEYKYVTKSGAPDKRYSDNPLLHKCEYLAFEMKSKNGLQVIITASNKSKALEFVGALNELRSYAEKFVLNA